MRSTALMLNCQEVKSVCITVSSWQFKAFFFVFAVCILRTYLAPVAQLDRATAF